MRLLREIQRGREEFYELFIKFANFNTTLILTSLCFSIRTVVNSGKICVLNLQPSSLPSIHESDLKPYVVIIMEISVVHGLINNNVLCVNRCFSARPLLKCLGSTLPSRVKFSR